MSDPTKVADLPTVTSVAVTDYVIINTVVDSILTTSKITVANLLASLNVGSQVFKFYTIALIKIVTGQTETIVTGCDFTITNGAASISISWDLWTSQNDSGHAKVLTCRVRRTDNSGAILASKTINGTADAVDGRQNQWTDGYIDSSPTDGHYVLTVEETTGTAGSEVWAAGRNFEVIGG